MDRRLKAWDRLAREMPLAKLDAMTATVGRRLQGLAGKIIQGQVRGRTVVDLGK